MPDDVNPFEPWRPRPSPDDQVWQNWPARKDGEPEPEPEPELPPAAIAFPRAPGLDAPREWNLWDLERVARDQAGADVARDEERSFLLMYLREFAGPDGRLSADFDALVRDSFGEALRAAQL